MTRPPFAPAHMAWAMRAAESIGAAFRPIDPRAWALAEARRDGRRLFIGAHGVCPYPINAAGAVGVARDKSHAAALLAEAGLEIPEGDRFYVSDAYSEQREAGATTEAAIAYAESLGWPVFAKPNDGARGAFARLAADADALRAALAAMGDRHPVALVQRVLEGEERRLFVLDGRIVYHHRRESAALTADGAADIATLLDQEDARLRAQGLTPIDRADPALRAAMAAQGWGFDDAPPPGARLPLGGRRGVSSGGGAADLREAAPADFADIAARAAEALGLRVMGLDLILAPDRAAPVVLEANGAPGMTALATFGREDLAVAIWRRILQAGFEA